MLGVRARRPGRGRAVTHGRKRPRAARRTHAGPARDLSITCSKLGHRHLINRTTPDSSEQQELSGEERAFLTGGLKLECERVSSSKGKHREEICMFRVSSSSIGSNGPIG